MGHAAQSELPGLPPSATPELDALASRLRDVRLQRMALTEQEVEATEALIDALGAAGRTAYRFEDRTFTLVAGKTRVRMKTDRGHDDGPAE